MDWFMMGTSPPPSLLCQKVSIVVDDIRLLGEPQRQYLFILTRITSSSILTLHKIFITERRGVKDTSELRKLLVMNH